MPIKTLKVLFITLISISLTYYVAVLAREYGHATTAWLFAYKSSPFEIIYGSWYLVPNTMNTISLLIILFILISCDPSKNWVKRNAL